MKLRVRSVESKETQRIEVPNTCNLKQLKEAITLHLFPSSNGNLLLSLNRKDELCGSSPDESLQSLGLTSGDLIYYSQSPFAFSSQTPNLAISERSFSVNNVDLSDTQKLESGKIAEIGGSSDEKRDVLDTQMEGSSKWTNPNEKNRNFVNSQMVDSDKLSELGSSSDGKRDFSDTHMEEGNPNLTKPNEKNQNLVNTQKVESGNLVELGVSCAQTQESVVTQMKETEGVDDMEVDDESLVDGKSKFSVPSFLNKVFVKEVGTAAANGGDHRLLVIAVHAVLLESGFVGYDPVSGMKVDGFHLPDEWPSSAFGITLHYTLPEVSEVVETVIVKFQTLGKFVNVYGSLSKKGFGVHRVCLDEPRFVPALSFVWKKNDDVGMEKECNESMKLYPNREIFEFWKIVKDGLSYPLLIELCDEMGLVPPPCLMRLPTELKLKILESLPAVNVAKVACVCSELRFVSSNNDLWRLKYEEEFGNAAESQRECQWKTKFSSSWEIRKKRKRVRAVYSWREPSVFRPVFPGRRDPNPLGFPFIIGGDFDRSPAFGFPQNPGRRTFRLNCNLGGFGP